MMQGNSQKDAGEMGTRSRGMALKAGTNVNNGVGEMLYDAGESRHCYTGDEMTKKS